MSGPAKEENSLDLNPGAVKVLLVSQRIDWIEKSGFAGGVNSEDDTDTT